MGVAQLHRYGKRASWDTRTVGPRSQGSMDQNDILGPEPKLELEPEQELELGPEPVLELELEPSQALWASQKVEPGLEPAWVVRGSRWT